MLIKDYIEEIASYLIQYIAKEKRMKIILYGAGEKAQVFLRDYGEYIDVQCICDDDPNKQGTFLAGIMVKSFQELTFEMTKYPIFITSKWSDGITKKLRENSIEHVYHRFAIEYLLHIDELQQIFEKLADEYSKTVMLGLIRYVFTQRPDIFPEITQSTEQYFLSDIFNISDREIVIDGGAFTGDTLLDFLHCTNGKVGKYYCFEPDEYNYSHLKARVDGLQEENNIKCYNIGLFSHKDSVSFTSENSSASGINQFSNEVISVDSIDNILSGQPVTLIKMDIEGAEYQALLGAKQSILQYTPKLAVCIYHLAEDLWKIPMLISEFVNEYQLYIRHHNKDCWYESVLYAKLNNKTL